MRHWRNSTQRCPASIHPWQTSPLGCTLGFACFTCSHFAMKPAPKNKGLDDILGAPDSHVQPRSSRSWITPTVFSNRRMSLKREGAGGEEDCFRDRFWKNI